MSAVFDEQLPEQVTLMPKRSAQIVHRMNITKHYAEEDSVFVFPSQVIADSMEQRVALDCGVVAGNRFISWDRFKESVFPGREAQTPANSLLRRIFAQLLLEKNNADPFLSVIVPRRFRADFELHANSLRSLLPDLHLLRNRADLPRLVSPLLLKDIEGIYADYESFLIDHKRYEPSWIEKQYIPNSKNYRILFPELVEDFSLYADVLAEREEVAISAGAGEATELSTTQGQKAREAEAPAPIETTAKTTTELHSFGDHRQEIACCLQSIAVLVQRGVALESIAITLADYDALYPRVEYIARNMGLPISRRKARVLIDYPSVSWLQRLGSGGFSFDSMRGLLLDRAIPWKNRALNERMVQRAISEGLIEGGYRAWRSLARRVSDTAASRTDTSNEATYNEAVSIIDSLQRITSAQNMDALYGALYRFITAHLDTERWDGENEAAWQSADTCIKNAMAELEGFPDLRIHCLSFVTNELASTLYAPQREGGIAVYDYRVAPALNIDFHYCLNFNADATLIRKRGFQFLREDLRGRLFAEYSDLSDAYVQAYGSCAQHTWISYSKQVQGSEVIPASIFLETEATSQSSAIPVHEIPKYAGQYGRQYGGQSGGEQGASQKQNRGSAQYGRWNIRGAGQRPPPSLAVSRLESWLRCPLGYFWQGFALAEMPLRPPLWPYKEIGRLFHSCMEGLYACVQKESPAGFDSKKMEQYKASASAIIRETFSNKFRLRGIPRIVHAHLEDLFSELALQSLEIDAEHWNGYAIHRLEQDLGHSFEIPLARSDSGAVLLKNNTEIPLALSNSGALNAGENSKVDVQAQSLRLRGRADRIMQKPDSDPASNSKSFAIIDYKMGSAPKPSLITGNLSSLLPSMAEQAKMDEESALKLFNDIESNLSGLQSVQLLAYVLLLEAMDNNANVEEAAYFSARSPGYYVPVIQTQGASQRTDRGAKKQAGRHADTSAKKSTDQAVEQVAESAFPISKSPLLPMKNPSLLSLFKKYLRDSVSDMHRAVAVGDFCAPEQGCAFCSSKAQCKVARRYKNSQRGCESCTSRALCRYKFSIVRRPEQ